MEDSANAPISKKENKLLWFAILFGTGLAVTIALIVAESLPRWRIYALVTVGALFFYVSFFVIGWHKGSSRWKTAFKTLVLFLVVLGGLGWKAWPKPPTIEISKRLSLPSIDIAPGSEANIGALKNDFTISFTLCQNDGKTFINGLAQPTKEEFPGQMFEYFVFNHNSYSVSNLKATFKASFMGGERGVTTLAVKDFDVYIKDIAPGSNYSFYVVNESRFNVRVDSPDAIELQIPGEEKTRVPILKGKVIQGTFPISDIAVKRGGELDLPLAGSSRNWDNAGCRD